MEVVRKGNGKGKEKREDRSGKERRQVRGKKKRW